METLLQMILRQFSTEELIRLCEESNVNCELVLMLKYEDLYGDRRLYPNLTWEENLLSMNVWSFGNNGFGQLGLGTNEKKNEPTPIETEDLPPITNISGGRFHSLLLDVDGRVWSFGDNGFGRLGLGLDPHKYRKRNKPTPIEAEYLPPIRHISAGGNHSLLLDVYGQVWAFGKNTLGQLGLGDTENKDIPTLIKDLKAIEISTGEQHSLLIGF